MNVGVLGVGGVTVLAIYGAAVLQYGGAATATEHLTWIIGLSILAASGGMAARTAL